jgi:PTH1 family peptidyl-tRNA hydrolase
MILVVGLGNVGRQYKDTPHNAGFEFLNAFRTSLIEEGYVADLWKNENMFQSEICKIRKDGELQFLLAKPTTYMNKSGEAVLKLVTKFSPDLVVIAHDDLDIKLGEFKVQVGKSPKNHNGVLSIEKIKGSSKYIRVRIGVEGRVDKRTIPGDIYVIRRMDKQQIEVLNESIFDCVVELKNQINPKI